MRLVLIGAMLLMIAACRTPPATNAVFVTYGTRRVELPRPVREAALARWVAVTDAAMIGAFW